MALYQVVSVHGDVTFQVMYMYYLLGYKIMANADLEPESDSFSGIPKKSESLIHIPHAKLTSSELRRRRTAAHFTRSIIFNYVPEEVQSQVSIIFNKVPEEVQSPVSYTHLTLPTSSYV